MAASFTRMELCYVDCQKSQCWVSNSKKLCSSNELVSLSDYHDFPVMEEEGNEAAGWRLARRGIHMALNNEVEGAQELLKAEVDGSGCPQAQAGFCFIAFMVSKGGS